MKQLAETREIVERMKDIMSNDVNGFVYDYMVADELKIGYSTLRHRITKNKPLSLIEIALFCGKRGILIDELVFNR